MIGSRNLIWKGLELYYRGEKVLQLRSDTDYPHMYWIEWIDGTLSEDYYNKTWAKQNAIALSLNQLRKEYEEEGSED